MTTETDCPACGEPIDALAVLDAGRCPECDTPTTAYHYTDRESETNPETLFELATGLDEPEIDYGSEVDA